CLPVSRIGTGGQEKRQAEPGGAEKHHPVDVLRSIHAGADFSGHRCAANSQVVRACHLISDVTECLWPFQPRIGRTPIIGAPELFTAQSAFTSISCCAR
ncbi:MAG: hypothetical protein ACK55Z_34815, partial [bacterium]